MFILKVKEEIDSSHFLRNYQGKCANMHGHRWVLEIELRGNDDQLDDIGMLVDFGVIKDNIQGFDHQCLNNIYPFNELNPTAENLAKYFCEIIPHCYSVTVYETPNNACTYMKGNC